MAGWLGWHPEELEAPEIFRVALPDGRLAWVAPGETMPNYATLSGIDVEGPCMRYLQISKDLDEIAGLGVTHISGLATFDEPATFRLKRLSDGTIHITTNTGISLTNQWVGGDARCIEVLTLANQWLDITDQCPPNSISPHLLQEWSNRNQRTLVDFRIRV